MRPAVAIYRLIGERYPGSHCEERHESGEIGEAVNEHAVVLWFGPSVSISFAYLLIGASRVYQKNDQCKPGDTEVSVS